MTGPLGGWTRRDEPLIPAAVVGLGRRVPLLAEAAARRQRSGADLRASTAQDCLLVVGPAEHLPWADGVTYLGWEAGILLSTTDRPVVHPDLVAQALRQVHGACGLAVVGSTVIRFELSNGPVETTWLEGLAEVAP